MIGTTLTAITIVGLLLIGMGALVAPHVASAQYGIVVDDSRVSAFLRAMGVRDLAIGMLLGLLALGGSRMELGWGMLAGALVAVVDFWVVTADHRMNPPAPAAVRAAWTSRLLHAAGVVGLVTGGVALLGGF